MLAYDQTLGAYSRYTTDMDAAIVALSQAIDGTLSAGEAEIIKRTCEGCEDLVFARAARQHLTHVLIALQDSSSRG